MVGHAHPQHCPPNVPGKGGLAPSFASCLQQSRPLTCVLFSWHFPKQEGEEAGGQHAAGPVKQWGRQPHSLRQMPTVAAQVSGTMESIAQLASNRSRCALCWRARVGRLLCHCPGPAAHQPPTSPHSSLGKHQAQSEEGIQVSEGATMLHSPGLQADMQGSVAGAVHWPPDSRATLCCCTPQSLPPRATALFTPPKGWSW